MKRAKISQMYEFRTTLPQNDIFIYPIHDTLSMTKIVNAIQSQKKISQGNETNNARLYGDYTLEPPQDAGYLTVQVLDTAVFRRICAKNKRPIKAVDLERLTTHMRHEIVQAILYGADMYSLNQHRYYAEEGAV